MIFLPFLHFFSFIGCIYLAIFVLIKDPRSLVNRMCSILMVCYSLWNFGDIIVHNPDRSITEGIVRIMQNIASVGWISFASAILCFSLAFSKKEMLIKKKWFLFIVFIVPILFLYLQLTYKLTINPTPHTYGWSFDWSKSIWSYLFFAYYLTCTLLSVAIVYNFGRKTKIFNEKKQAKIIVIVFIVGIISGTLIDVVVQEIGFYNIPPITNLLVFVFASGVLYAIFKYRFLTITPTIAAENIVAAMDECLILLDPNGNIINVNKSTLDSLNYGKNELEGKPITMLFQDEIFKGKLIEIITKAEAISNLDSEFLSKTGKVVPIIYSSSPLKDNSGQVIGTVFIARDITLHKQIEYELIKSKEKAEESDRLKTAFLANMSHEIRTPMNAISGFSELIEFEDNEDKRRQYIKIIKNSSSILLNLVLDIVELSRIEIGDLPLKYSHFSVLEIFNELHQIFSNELVKRDKTNISLSYSLAENNTIIYSDKNRLIQVLSNLIDNAIKFTSKGTVRFSCERNEGFFIFSVLDTGTGIPVEDQKKIFDRFTKFDYNGLNTYGTGIGLSLVEKIVEKLKGRIWVESNWGEGSSFFFSVPEIDPLTVSETISFPESDKELINVPAKTGKTILVVEDDKNSFFLISEMLVPFGFDIHKAEDGKAAIEFIKMNPETQLVLMDMKLPFINGDVATKEIKKINPNIIVIAQTAFATAGDKEKALKAGCDNYITKPINMKELQKLVSVYLS